MEFWPGSIVLQFEGTACLLNAQSEAPVLESWLVRSSSPVARQLADRLGEAQDVHSRSTAPETHLAIGLAEAQVIIEALDERRDDLDDHFGLLNLRKALAALRP